LQTDVRAPKYAASIEGQLISVARENLALGKLLLPENSIVTVRGSDHGSCAGIDAASSRPTTDVLAALAATRRRYVHGTRVAF
jgi:hypothetical protein